MINPVYDRIGTTYNATRRADPYIASRVTALLQPETGKLYLDMGCGTGNYMHYLTERGFLFYGIDPSGTMLDVARVKCPGSRFIKGEAENIPLEDSHFDGAIALFTFHHWHDKPSGLNELFRVLKPGCRLVFLSFTAEQMDGYWLKHYFPEMIKRSGELVPDQDTMRDMLHQAGFSAVETEKYFVQEDLQDHFLYSNKFRPEQYLNPEIRKGISSFAAFSTPDELEQGLKRLETDIQEGAIQEVIKNYNNENGDYLFYVVSKA